MNLANSFESVKAQKGNGADGLTFNRGVVFVDKEVVMKSDEQRGLALTAGPDEEDLEIGQRDRRLHS